MTFDAPPESYDDFMGRYSRLLAPKLAEFAGIGPGMRAIDVGCGPGALTELLATTLGAERVTAADPSPTFARACAERVPGADVREVPAESLPWDDGSFDAAVSQLVVNFMNDPEAGVGEMRRVVASGGPVAACVWDGSGGMEMLSTFWEAAKALDPAVNPESARLRSAEELRSLWDVVGLEGVETGALDVEVVYEGFEDSWHPLTGGVGPAGAHAASLDPAELQALRDECRRRLGEPPGGFALQARAWAVRGLVP